MIDIYVILLNIYTELTDVVSSDSALNIVALDLSDKEII